MVNGVTNQKHKRWHRAQVIQNNLGATNTERLIQFCLPTLNVKCMYPPKHIDADISVINLRKEFEKINEDTYTDFEQFMDSLKMFVPFESYTEDGIYTNLKYKRNVFRDVTDYITDDYGNPPAKKSSKEDSRE